MVLDWQKQTLTFGTAHILTNANFTHAVKWWLKSRRRERYLQITLSKTVFAFNKYHCIHYEKRII